VRGDAPLSGGDDRQRQHKKGLECREQREMGAGRALLLGRRSRRQSREVEEVEEVEEEEEEEECENPQPKGRARENGVKEKGRARTVQAGRQGNRPRVDLIYLGGQRRGEYQTQWRDGSEERRSSVGQ
jgi:hypothetical protein